MKKLMNLFGGSSQRKAEQEKEIEYRRSRANAQRMISAQRRLIEKTKNEAIALEAQGEHAMALSKASQIKPMENRIRQAEQNLRTCEAAHNAAKEQREWVEMTNLFKRMGESILGEMKPDEIMVAQQKGEMVMTELEEMNVTMTAIAEGITEGTDMELHSAEGEAALAALMQEKSGRETRRLPETVKPVKPEEEEPEEEDTLWNDKARAMLAELGVQ